jgi:hypothetical protein
MATASFDDHLAGKCVVDMNSKLVDQALDKHVEDVEDEVMLQRALRK